MLLYLLCWAARESPQCEITSYLIYLILSYIYWVKLLQVTRGLLTICWRPVRDKLWCVPIACIMGPHAQITTRVHTHKHTLIHRLMPLTRCPCCLSILQTKQKNTLSGLQRSQWEVDRVGSELIVTVLRSAPCPLHREEKNKMIVHDRIRPPHYFAMSLKTTYWPNHTSLSEEDAIFFFFLLKLLSWF